MYHVQPSNASANPGTEDLSSVHGGIAVFQAPEPGESWKLPELKRGKNWEFGSSLDFWKLVASRSLGSGNLNTLGVKLELTAEVRNGDLSGGVVHKLAISYSRPLLHSRIMKARLLRRPKLPWT